MKKKWRNIKDTYAKYLRSTNTKTGKVAKKNYKHWQWAPNMDFFRPFYAFAHTDTEIRDKVGDTNDTDEVIENTAFDGNEEENEKLENSDELAEAAVASCLTQSLNVLLDQSLYYNLFLIYKFFLLSTLKSPRNFRRSF